MGRNVIITGTSSGIGKSILEEFSKEKDITIIAHARKPSPQFELLLKNLNRENENLIIPVYFDLINAEHLTGQINNVLKAYKKIDVLVNNAGMIQPNSSFLMTSLDTIKESFQINFFSQVLLTQLVARSMIRNRIGNIVNIASIAAFDVTTAQFEYVTSKAAIVAMTMKLAIELAPFGIRCNAVAPGLIKTKMLENMEKELKNNLCHQAALNRLGMPEEISKLVYFLASKDSSFINGQTIRVDGGRGVI